MSDKKEKTAMQMLLLASGFALILMYLYFTKGACLEMKDTEKLILTIAAIFFLVCIGSLMLTCIWNFGNDDKEQYILCFHSEKNYLFIAEENSTVPDGTETVVVKNLDVLDTIKFSDNPKLKDIYIKRNSGSVSAKKLEELGKLKDVKIHFISECCELKIKKSENAQQPNNATESN